jgi:hypothetical protein
MQNREKNQMNFKILSLITAIVFTITAPVSAANLNQELARARAATARYHDVSQAEADGYVQDICHLDGCHWFNWDYYLDGTFDIERPEALTYIKTKNDGWRLVSVEYIVPTDGLSNPPPPAPEGFTGDADASAGDKYGWRYGTEGFPDWELSVWIWFNNPNGMFAMENPRLEQGEE